ncbi:Terpene cyclase [Mycena sanguinolenta]|uniref:Terpene synthase n=1 Tax=Mycena sanguinolenta TaxID=230812 RepID=A0A8H6ZCQ3_9AGAR|nr:Terpene cyclase [Mycena sanguinolenta]
MNIISQGLSPCRTVGRWLRVQYALCLDMQDMQEPSTSSLSERINGATEKVVPGIKHANLSRLVKPNMTQTATQTIYLPNPLKDVSWPWGRRMNPFYDEVKKEADNWFLSLECFDEKSTNSFVRCDFARMAALCYPDMTREEYRVACDMFTLFFVFDEFTDIVDGKGAQELADLTVQPLKNLAYECGKNEHPLTKVAFRFWKHFMAIASGTCKELFISAWKQYIDGVIQEAKDRQERTIPRSFDTGDYLRLRKLTAGVAPCIAIYFIGKECPRGFFGHPMLIRLAEITIEIVCFENDTYSFQKESATEDIHNLLKAIMYDHVCSVQDAVYHAAGETKARAEEFLMLAKTLQSQGPDVQAYIQDLGSLISGHTLWSFETPRYFGKDCKKVEKDRTFILTEEKKRLVCWE